MEDDLKKNEKWKTTSKKIKWKKTSTKNNGRQPQKKLKTTSTKMEDDLNKNGRRPQQKWKTTSTKMEDDPPPKKLKKMENNRRKRKKKEDDLKKNFSQFLLNLGAYLSWGWLSSPRFISVIIQAYFISYKTRNT
jgi:hypothetical protein